MPKQLKEFRDDVERRYIVDTLTSNDWNVSKVSAILGIERTNLHKKMRALGIARPGPIGHPAISAILLEGGATEGEIGSFIRKAERYGISMARMIVEAIRKIPND